MNILQSTFEKHKKLMLENLGVINETELYHATKKSDIESFTTNGIKPELSGREHGGAGGDDPRTGQGSGFYVFKDKKNAISHANSMKYDAIVVIDQDITPEDFDIDYEVSGDSLRKFITSQSILNHLIDVLKRLDIKRPNGSSALVQDKAGTVIAVMLPVKSRNGAPETRFELDAAYWSDNDDSVGGAVILSRFAARVLKKYAPEIFDRFEKENLTKVPAIKYNGTKKIWPVRVEDLQGNIIWKADNK